MKCTPVAAMLLAPLAAPCPAVPTALISIPSTDVQEAETVAVGMDRYSNFGATDSIATGVTSLVATFGLGDGFEVGMTVASDTPHPLSVDAKYTATFGKDDKWGAAVGACGFNFAADESADICTAWPATGPAGTASTWGTSPATRRGC